MADPITRQELEDASTDAASFETFINNYGTVTTRLGASYKTILSTLQDIDNSKTIRVGSWSELLAKPGTFAGQGGDVITTATTSHTDPVVGGSVLDSGAYSWVSSPAGWKRIGDVPTMGALTVKVADIVPSVLSDDFRRGYDFYWSQQDPAGKVAFGVNPFGEFYARKIDDRTLALLGGTVDPSTWGGTKPVAIVYPPINGYQLASAQGPKASQYLVRRKVASTHIDGLYYSSSPLVVDTYGGQSGSFNSGTTNDPNTIYEAVWPHNWVMLAGQGYAIRASQTTYTPENINDFEALKEYALGSTYNTVGNQSLGVLGTIVQEDMQRELKNSATEGGCLLLSGQGGTPLEEHIPPTPVYPKSQEAGSRSYARLLSSLEAIKRIANDIQGRKIVVDFHHYPSNEGGATTPIETNNLWFTMFRDYYVAQVKAAIKGITTQLRDPHIIMTQNVTQAAQVAPFAVIAAQLEATKFYDGNGVTCYGPMYPYELDPDAADGIHARTLGRMQCVELIEVVKSRIRAGIKHRPMYVEAASISGVNIDLTFGRPYGSGPLKFDTDTIAAIVNQGFRVQVNGSETTVSSVTITGENTVRVVVSAAPATGANVDVMIAYGGSAVTALPNWSRARTTLMREDIQLSSFYKRGYTVPKYVRHHAMNEIYRLVA